MQKKSNNMANNNNSSTQSIIKVNVYFTILRCLRLYVDYLA